MKKKIKKRRPQINFEDAELAPELKAISDLTNIPQATIGRVALREKLAEMRDKINKGEEVTVTF